MSVINGLAGRVNGESTVRNWSITSSADLQALIASNTKGGTVRLDGNVDWNGNYTGYGPQPSVFPGEYFTFQGALTSEVTDTNCAESDVNGAIVDSIEVAWDIEGGAPIGYTVNFSGNGGITFSTSGTDIALDTTDPRMYSSIGTVLKLVDDVPDTPVVTQVADLRSMTLTITADNKSYASSDTAGKIKRVPGNIDVQVTASVYTDDFASLPAVNLSREWRMYVNATEYWIVKWCKFGEASDLSVDPESGDPIGATLNASFNAIKTVGTTAPAITTGVITTPGVSGVAVPVASTNIWP